MERVPAPWAIFLALTIACLSPPAAARADAYDPPPTYYSTATGTGATLKSQLNGIIDGHTNIGYDAARSALQVTDADPAKLPGYMLTVYDRTSLHVAAINPGGNPPGWDNAATWNREHVWPRSRGILDSGMDDSDLFNLRPALTDGNGARANYNFGGTFGAQSFGLITAPNPDMWYAGDAEAAMIARQAFYMAVRYDGADSSTTDLELAVGNPAASTGTLGDKDRLLEWHFAAPPDNFERRRNQVIYDQYQHNRNPFTDRPEWAWSVFVDNANDSSLALAGGVVGDAGATTLNVDLERRLIGSSLPAGQVVTLNKGGVDGTYYSVSAAGAATSTVTGRFNAFGIGALGSRTFTVGLASGTSTATAGLKSGTVTIDNLDVTSGGGAANGANDGNDVITVGVSILDHANPSFTLGSDLNTLTLDFGAVTVGAAAPTLNFSLANLAATAGFTAALDLDGVSGSGATAVLATNLAPFSGAQSLTAGTSRSFQAMLSTAAVGSFEASYVLNFSDENLVGASTLGSLTLNLTGSVVAATPTGDFDGDSDVDGGDFLIWQTGLGEVGTAMRSDGDADGDQDVDEADYAIWRSTFVDPSGPPSHLVAEPTGSCLVLVSLLLLIRPSPARRRRLIGGNAPRGGISVARRS